MNLPRVACDGVELCELQAFIAVAEHRSFTAAGLQLDLSLPTMSQRIRTLEERLGVRLFQRTTRNVSLTEAGARLLGEVQPLIKRLGYALESASSAGQTAGGLLRLAVTGPFTTRLLAPLLRPFLAAYPEIRLDIVIDDARTDLLKGGFDARVRVDYQVERDMTALPITGPYRMLAVAAPSYLKDRQPPQEPGDLLALDCIAARAPLEGALLAWMFVKGDQRTELAVDGRVTVNNAEVWLSCALDGLGVAYLPEPLVAAHIARRELINLLPDWSGERSGIFLHYPSRCAPSSALQALIGYLAAAAHQTGGWAS